MMINVRNVGHVVLKVRDLERSVRFYRDVLGLKEVARGTFDLKGAQTRVHAAAW
jgi:catechol 2,3-dioxygenase-like lactoylglutathione lyase family enzyme